MIEVFKTNVETAKDAEQVIAELLTHMPQSEINFDLDDCDRILRIKAAELYPEEVIRVLNERHYQCEVLA